MFEDFTTADQMQTPQKLSLFNRGYKEMRKEKYVRKNFDVVYEPSLDMLSNPAV